MENKFHLLDKQDKLSDTDAFTAVSQMKRTDDKTWKQAYCGQGPTSMAKTQRQYSCEISVLTIDVGLNVFFQLSSVLGVNLKWVSEKILKGLTFWEIH